VWLAEISLSQPATTGVLGGLRELSGFLVTIRSRILGYPSQLAQSIHGVYQRLAFRRACRLKRVAPDVERKTVHSDKI